MFNKLAIALAALIVAPTVASAALLDVPTRSVPVLTDTSFAGYNSDIGEFFFFGSGAGASSEPVAAGDIFAQIGAEIGFGGGSSGTGEILADNSPFGSFELTGTLAAFGFEFGATGEDDILQFLFDVTSGPAAYGSRVLATLVGEFGADAADVAAHGFDSFAGLTVVPAVPLPMPALLLPTALAGLAWRARRKAA